MKTALDAWLLVLMAMLLAAAVFVASVLVGCGRTEPDAASATGTAESTPAVEGPRAAFIPTHEQLERFRAEGPDPTLRKIAVADYWLNYKLMQASGIERELGGEAQAVEALKALGNAYEKRLRIAEAELPRMMPVAFTGEGMSSGFLGMGMGSFLGIVSGGMSSAAVSQMSDAELKELSSKGPIKHEGNGGSAELHFREDGSLSQSLEFEVNESGVNGKVKMKIQMAACPDPDGRVTVEIDVDSQMSVSGKPGTGGHVKSQFKYERFLDDDAQLIDNANGGASKLRVNMGGYENFETQSVDITTGYERGGNVIWENHGERGFSIFRPEEVERTRELLRSTELLQTIMAEAMLRGMGSGTRPAWESGRCIDLQVTSSPSKRTGLKPDTHFDLEARPRAKPGGEPAGGTVTATLTGGASLQPSSGKVKADAKYAYVGPEEKEKTASIAFESRSKRGVGRASLDFDTKLGRAYSMEGGADEFHGTGVVCNLAAQFTVQGSGVTVTFVPSSEFGGSYSYSGNMSGFAVYGNGTYTVTTDGEVATGITATGPGSVKTPMGVQTSTGTEKYTLTPLKDGCPGP
jgi:hypothetical protein